MSGTNLLEPPGPDPVQRCKQVGHEGQKILNPIRTRHDEHDAEGEHRDVLRNSSKVSPPSR